MSTLKQIIRLKQQGKNLKQIVRICQTSRNTVRKYVALSDQSSFTVDELLNMDDQALELALLPVDSKGRDDRYQVLVAQLEHYQKELRRTGVNRWVLWSEYRLTNDGRYCDGICFKYKSLYFSNRQSGIFLLKLTLTISNLIL